MNQINESDESSYTSIIARQVNDANGTDEDATVSSNSSNQNTQKRGRGRPRKVDSVQKAGAKANKKSKNN
ncbi:unnamed protein product [Brachionus calyciflorus]|uniref:Uncharacterized protein n=1 Tax=Brachionus calyciflorus TaxID=104777 RepID=A0A814QE11_9BILA|nr:unnamed protein product [Brachionus calyciflorus]